MSNQMMLAGLPQATRQSKSISDSVDSGYLWDPANHIANWHVGRDASYLFQIWRTALPICFADIASVAVTVGIASVFLQFTGGTTFQFIGTLFACCCLMLLGGLFLSGLYPGAGITTATEARVVSRVIAAGVTLCMAYDWAHGGANTNIMLWPFCGLILVVLVPMFRAGMKRVVGRSKWWGIRTIIIGTGNRGLDIVNRIKQNPSLGLKPVAMVDRYRHDWILQDERLPFGRVSALEDTPRLSSRLNAYCGVFVGSEFPASDRLNMVDSLTSVFPQLYVTTDAAEAGRHWSGVMQLGDVRLLRITEHLLMPGARWIKRGVDITAVLLASPLVVPLVLVLAALVKLSSKGSAFYRCRRVGRNGSTIWVWKLRTMIPNAEQLLEDYLNKNPELRADWERIHKLPKDPRVTTIGKFLRKTSLDELPQLLNVLTGDMSLVGPRPIPHDQVEKYQHIYPLYIRVTPGITGLWQINGRSSTTHEVRVGYDAEYVRNWSISLDMYILVRTVQTVITCDGAC